MTTNSYSKLFTVLRLLLMLSFIGLICAVSVSIILNAIRPQNQITSDVVIDRVTSQLFLVTRTVYSDQELQIKIDRASEWNEFLWGKEISASGRVRVDLGVDLQGITNQDVRVDNTLKQIYIKAPAASILDASLQSKLTVTTGGSILTQIFDRNTNADYKMAVDELVSAAERAGRSDTTLLAETKTAAGEYLSLLFASSGYRVTLE